MDLTKLDLTALYDLADECIAMYRQEINAIQAIGYNRGLMNSTATWVQDGENGIKMQFVLPDYYIFVEQGRNPTKKAENPEYVYQQILKWVKAKNIVGRAVNGKKPPTQEQLAWAIYRKVVGFAKDANSKNSKKYGVGYYGDTSQGKHPLETTIQRMESANMKQRVADIVASTLNNEIHVELMDMAKLKKG